jgi:predicted GIY-YIG superfamily endonuclease
MTRAAVYRHYDAQGVLLYVGCSTDPIARTKSHRSKANWFDQVARIDVEWFDSKSDALAAEREQTQALSPRYLPASPDRKRRSAEPQTVLAQYIATQPKRPMAEWADDLGVSRPMIYDLMSGERLPSLPVAKRIADATDGAVPLSSWKNHAAVIEAAA